MLSKMFIVTSKNSSLFKEFFVIRVLVRLVLCGIICYYVVLCGIMGYYVILCVIR